jgi:hypothetical protein
VAEVGVPAESPTLPPPMPVDVEHTVRVAAGYGYQITG